MISKLFNYLRRWFLAEEASASQTERPASVPVPARDAGRDQLTTVKPASKAARSLEELRADLARLRASSKDRHAPVPVARPSTFDESVFADFHAPAAGSAPATDAAEDYSRTVLVPRPSAKRPR